MGLGEYRRKRDFRRTPEPRGRRAAHSRQLAFLIQKHDASHLHYDFRLEWDGVLKSWAVPKGPDLDPANKRLAMQVEDHPLEYGDFEGTIPKGQYGGGTVMLWDRGTWEPVGYAEQGFREGRLKFVLHGEKLKGAWMLVRQGGRKAESGERHWFLFKERDEFAKSGKSITDTKPLSVATRRDLNQIAAASDRVWGANGKASQNGHANSKRPSAEKAVEKPRTSARAANKRHTALRASKTAGRAKAKTKPHAKGKAGNEKAKSSSSKPEALLRHSAAKTARLPTAQAVELATLAKTAPDGDDWLHEIKFDGYRMLCRVDGGKARFISRNGHDWTEKFLHLARAAGDLAIRQAMLDGEVVALQSDGTTRFQALQNVFQTGRTEELVYYVFDVLHLNGRSLTGVPLDKRKEILKLLVPDDRRASIRFSDHLAGTGPEVFRQACRMHLEGIVSKRRDSTYRPGRGTDWLKIKCSAREEFVIGGFTPPGGSRAHFGAILIGYYDADKKLIYAGRVGTGFDAQTLTTLHGKFRKLEQAKSPFANLSGTTGQARGVKWLQPKLVAEVEFSNWTDEGLLRHPAFQGLREDKPAIDVVRESPISPSEVKDMKQHDATATAQSSRRKTQRSRPKTQSSRGKSRSAGKAKKQSDSMPDRAPGEAEIAGVRISHPDKVLYPDDGVTKRDLADYYAAVGKWMLPHVANRALAIVRCPAGLDGPRFFQKHPSAGATEQLLQVDVSTGSKPEFNLAIGDLSGLVALVQMGVLEIHAWGSQAKRLETPDRLTFDLDPDPAVEWPQVAQAAREVRQFLDDLGLVSFLKTTGGKGLHIVVPIRPRLDWDRAKDFCKLVADAVVRAAPDRYIATMSKAARKGKIFIDYLRNGRGATAIAPYSTRAKAGAPVSVPIAWDELSARLRSDYFTVANVPSRLAKLKSDPWAELAATKQAITKAMFKRLAE